MPLKPGGGNHMQLYDSQNGEYTTQEKERMRRIDDEAISSFEIYGEESMYKFHFPIENVHKDEYCRRFVQNVRQDVKEPSYVEAKMNYLLKYDAKKDKSNFLLSLGYSKNDGPQLFNDICKNTNRSTIEF